MNGGPNRPKYNAYEFNKFVLKNYKYLEGARNEKLKILSDIYQNSRNQDEKYLSQFDVFDEIETNESKNNVKSVRSTVIKENGQVYKIEVFEGDQRENKIKSVDIFLKTIESTAKKYWEHN